MDLSHEAAGAQDATEGTGVIADVPVRIEMLLDLARHPDGAVLACNRKGRAEGGQLGGCKALRPRTNSCPAGSSQPGGGLRPMPVFHSVRAKRLVLAEAAVCAGQSG